MKNKLAVLLGLIILCVLFQYEFAIAESYDLYVDKNYSGDEEGTSAKPYKKIADALDKADKGDKIYIKNGTYEEALVLGEGIGLYGQEKSKTIIKNYSDSSTTIKGKGNNVLRNLTISGGYSGIVFEKKGEVKNCIIKNVKKNAIDAVLGSSELKVTDSKITGNGKGIYVEMNRTILISNNEFSDNAEEGIDIREKAKGLVEGNSITGSGEGGIEIVIGSSNVDIKNNKISKNKASGIAAQFYTQASKTGEVVIQNNIISQNGHFGIVCNAPSGGDTPKNYWNNSLKLIDNTIENNKKIAVSKTCKIVEAVTEEEIKENEIPANEIGNDNEETPDEEELEPENIYNQFELAAIAEMDGMKLKNSEFSSLYPQLIENIEKRSRFKFFFIGPDHEKISQLKQLNEQQKNSLARLQEIKSSSDNDLLNEIVEPLMQEAEKNIRESNLIIENQESKFSLFGWLFRLF